MKKIIIIASVLAIMILGISTAIFTGMQTSDVQEEVGCRIIIQENLPCGSHKFIMKSKGLPDQTREKEEVCSSVMTEIINECNQMNCEKNCPPKFVKRFERISEITNLCTISGICVCGGRENIPEELAISEDNTCKLICPDLQKKKCEEIKFELPQEAAERIINVAKAYQRGYDEGKGNQLGDQELTSFLQEGACALGLGMLPIDSSYLSSLEKYRRLGFTFCGREISIEPDFNSLLASLREQEQLSLGLKGDFQIAKGIIGNARMNPDKSYSAEINIDVCALLGEK